MPSRWPAGRKVGTIARGPAWIKTGFAKAKKKRLSAGADGTTVGAAWQGMIRFNTFTQQIEVVSNIPRNPGQQAAGWRPCPIEDILAVRMHLHENGFEQVGKNAVRDAAPQCREHSCSIRHVTLESLPPWMDRSAWKNAVHRLLSGRDTGVPGLTDTGHIEHRTRS